MIDLVLIVLGAVVLAFAGSRLVDFAVAIAAKAHLTPAVIGLTIVAAGTSMPELAVSVTGALRGAADIALGNVVGSNIANIGLILGACAAITVVPVARGVLRFEYPFLVLSSWIVLLLARDGRLDRLEGAFFVASLIAFTVYAVWVARREIDEAEQGVVASGVPDGAEPLSRRPTGLLVLGIGATLVGLVLGAQALVGGAVGIARVLGLSERVVGLTIVAVGTSLPELAVSVAAALKKQQELAVANVVGSNVFNLLMILGAAALARPLAVNPGIVAVDLWVMVGFSLVLLPLVYRRLTLSRAGGVGLLVLYAGYVAWLAFSPAAS